LPETLPPLHLPVCCYARHLLKQGVLICYKYYEKHVASQTHFIFALSFLTPEYYKPGKSSDLQQVQGARHEGGIAPFYNS
jgi:hypothetical protein